ncbi:hypothetical protein H106_06908 [Trichophyton rubrum CBS 735.88]|nr:hypothetical protein H106_06908 [Trichophyton rubrum CBS 735.88]
MKDPDWLTSKERHACGLSSQVTHVRGGYWHALCRPGPCGGHGSYQLRHPTHKVNAMNTDSFGENYPAQVSTFVFHTAGFHDSSTCYLRWPENYGSWSPAIRHLHLATPRAQRRS